MDFIKEALEKWIKEILSSGIKHNLSGMFDAVNDQVSHVTDQIGQTPQEWNTSIFDMIHNISETIIVPIAGLILTFVMALELIQLITDRNNLHDIDAWVFLKWLLKSFAAIVLVANTWTLVMGVFDVGQSVVFKTTGLVQSTSISIDSITKDLDATLGAMEVGPLLGLWVQSLFVGLTMWPLTLCIFLVTYGRMMEIYLVTSLAPIPVATTMNKEWGNMGQNYIRSILALAFQAFLIVVCVAIYSVLIQNILTSSDIIGSIWSCVGYTALLCMALFKTGAIVKSIFTAH